MTGIELNQPIFTILSNTFDKVSARIIDRTRAIQVIKIVDLQNDLNLIQKKVLESVTPRSERDIEAHTTRWKTSSLYPFLSEIFVVVRRAVYHGHKLTFHWFSPCRISTIHYKLGFSVTLFRGEKSEPVHCRRLLKYHEILLGTTVLADIR